jgi:hypothetical protein
MKSALFAAAIAAAACGKQTFLAAAFVQTPSLPNPANPSQPIPQYQIVTAYFGTIDTTDPTSIDASKVAGVADAGIDISFDHVLADGGVAPRDLYTASTAPSDNKWTQPESGTYELNSQDEPLLTFELGQPYRLVLIDSNGDAYGAEFVPGPADDMQEFQNTSCSNFEGLTIQPVSRCIQTHANNTDLTIDRCNPGAGGCTAESSPEPAFIVVVKVDPNNPTANPNIVYTTVPQDPVSLLKYELSDQPYRFTTAVIPGSQAFQTSGLYAVVLVTAKPGKVSGNAFLGSTAVVGTGAAGLVQVQ